MLKFKYKTLPSFLMLFLSATSLTSEETRMTPAPNTQEQVQAEATYGLKMSYGMHHFRSVYPLTIQLWYSEAKDGKTPEVSEVKKQIIDYLDKYPNEKDWWEEINKQLVIFLRSRYPSIRHIQSNLAVSPNEKIPFGRTSTVEIDNQQLSESFEFKLPYVDGLKDHFKQANLKISYNYVDDLKMLDHPDFRAIGSVVDQYVGKNLKDVNQWDAVDQQLEQVIKQRFPVIKTVKIELVSD